MTLLLIHMRTNMIIKNLSTGLKKVDNGESTLYEHHMFRVSGLWGDR